MKPRRKVLRIERTNYADSYLAEGGKNGWRIQAPGLSVTVHTEDEVLLHVRTHMALELEAEHGSQPA